jgi:hypothetical protein
VQVKVRRGGAHEERIARHEIAAADLALGPAKAADQVVIHDETVGVGGELEVEVLAHGVRADHDVLRLPILDPDASPPAVRPVAEERAIGATNLTWVFHANDADIPHEAWKRVESYYPGDDVADWVGVSVYGAGTPMEDEWSPFAEKMDAIAPRLVAMAPGKPLFVLEFGFTAGNPRGEAAAWADEALGQILSGRWPTVRGFSWWNESWSKDDNPTHDNNIRVQDNARLTAGFRARLAAGNVLDRPILRG